MDKVALFPQKERSELFEATARGRGVHPAIIEKDFWVCWVLKKLFESPNLSRNLIFKGGTSLSKVFGLIERFSEDIDLILNWELLGYGSDADDPYQELDSGNKLNKFNAEFNRRASAYIEETLLPEVLRLLAICPDVTASISPDDRQVIEIGYPAAFELSAIRPEVKLEIGPLASWVPSVKQEISPYAAIDFPKVFQNPGCQVIAISAERTFWEKATILHQQAHRASPMPPAYSRHYYDMFKLAGSEVRQRALTDLDLLRHVVDFKNRFYRSAWARYDLATPGTLRLLPTEQGDKELRADYVKMRPMIFGNVPTWEEITGTIAELEREINGHADSKTPNRAN